MLILAIQTLNNLSYERMEYLINNRVFFMSFLGPSLSDRVPDAKTVWLFRERLIQAGAIDVLFNRFDITLRNVGHLPMSGEILDTTLVAVPKQRNSTLRKRVFERDGHYKTGRTCPQSFLAKILMRL